MIPRMTDTIETASDTRTQILKAATERIHHYGYSKTTMSEIARDCNMSAGNIYRFFASKLDIAEAMAREFNAVFYEKYAEIGARDVAASMRLREIFHYSLEYTFNAIDEDAKILEVAEVLKRERPDSFNSKLADERTYLVPILINGMEKGEFRTLESVEETAEFIQSALMKFGYPQLFTRLSLTGLRRELDGVLDLLLAGLSKEAIVPPR